MLDEYQTLLQRSSKALAAGDLMSADAFSRKALTLRPKSVPALVLQGTVRTRQGQWQQAEEAFARAEKLAPAESEVHFGMGVLRVRQGRHAEALPLLEKAQRLKPEHPGYAMARAECHRRLGDPRKAIAILGTPTIAETHLAAGQAHMDLGELDAAERHLRSGIELAATLGAGASAKTQLHHVLGEVLEKRGDFEGAFREYAASRAVAPVRFNPADARAYVERIRQTFQRELFDRVGKLPIPSKRPIFIAGMPRSGTTLVEKMIAAHPKGAGAGETSALRSQIDEWVDTLTPSGAWPAIVRSFLPQRYSAIASRYLAATDIYAGPGIERVADKHLANWMYVGLIALAFPEATIIHIKRDPMDTGISCFERLLSTAAPWSSDLRSIGMMLALNESLMAHWHAMLPGRIVQVQYEDLAKKPAETLPPILAAAGLEWSDACLRHHERKLRPGAHEPPPTLSEDQIKRPVYDSSIGRAERFSAALDPLRESYRTTRAELGL
ncbi:MAG: sulfotransferase [Phycisphaerales bacterium]